MAEKCQSDDSESVSDGRNMQETHRSRGSETNCYSVNGDLPTSSSSSNANPSNTSEGMNKGKQKDFSHPVYKNISQFNGLVNKMKKKEIINRLQKYSMDTNGETEILKRRLKNCYRKRKLKETGVGDNKSPTLDYIIIIDYEATCEIHVSDYRHEIIEFPAVLMNVSDGSMVSEFRSYCKPIENPKLTRFCTGLTGITQEQVDKAEEFPIVLENFEKWLTSHKLGVKRGFKFAVATDGPWDMRRFLFYQCQMLDIPFPKWAKKWVNLRKLFANFYRRERGNIENMLRHLGLEFEGRQHCGMDDTRNIARIAQRLIKDGCFIDVNEGFSGNEKGKVLEIKPEKNHAPVDFPEPKPVNIKSEEEKLKDIEVREALRKLQLKEDDELAAFYKSINRY